MTSEPEHNDGPSVGRDLLLQRLIEVHGNPMTSFDPWFTPEEWQKLSLSFQKQWWVETKFGKQPPSPELIERGKAELNAPEKKASP